MVSFSPSRRVCRSLLSECIVQRFVSSCPRLAKLLILSFMYDSTDRSDDQTPSFLNQCPAQACRSPSKRTSPVNFMCASPIKGASSPHLVSLNYGLITTKLYRQQAILLRIRINSTTGHILTPFTWQRTINSHYSKQNTRAPTLLTCLIPRIIKSASSRPPR